MPDPDRQDERNDDITAHGDQPWHAVTIETAFEQLRSGPSGLDDDEVSRRRRLFGPNELPKPKSKSLFAIYLGQFRSPLIYLLLAAAALSLGIGEYADAVFIFAVLQVNAAIGCVQEWNAATAAAALDALTPTQAMVRRGGHRTMIDGRELVPGDVVELASGAMVPADMLLIEARELSADESLLTGESVPSAKEAGITLDPETALGDRRNQVFAGTTVLSGRAAGLVVRTAVATQVGRIAAALTATAALPPPLLGRLAKFSRALGVAIIVAIAIVAAGQIAQGVPPAHVFFVGVALAVSAIPEGLPVAVTVALSVASARMARRRVVVRRLPAVEGLGACTLIASDKTGTLTRNELTVRRLFIPGQGEFDVSGEGYGVVGHVTAAGAPHTRVAHEAWMQIMDLARAGELCNEASIYVDAEGVSHVGDTVDVALLVLARKVGLEASQLAADAPRVSFIPFEPEKKFAASFHREPEGIRAYVKGAAEVVTAMCRADAAQSVLDQAEDMARDGYRVIAIAAGGAPEEAARGAVPDTLANLEFLGLVGIIDPVRGEVPAAIRQCRGAGIEVRMVTGDHPATALAISRELGIASAEHEVVTGMELSRVAGDPAKFDADVMRARVFARVEPTQKLSIVESLKRAGNVVAVTGDGVNDAPALREADIGVAMGKEGTDIARSAADLILSDDNFASIVAGVEEGRIAYANVRKVIYLAISTGAAEVALFGLALVAGLPLPLFAVQLLWLNLVTNGIQMVALAFEAGEPGIMKLPPRPPKQPIFDRRMLSQTVVSGLFIAAVAYIYFHWLMGEGVPETTARNQLLLLMVLFENVHLFNCRSESRSAFQIPFRANPFLILGVIGAQGIHVAAMYTPGLRDVLGVEPVSFDQWAIVAVMAVSVIAVMEIYKRIAQYWDGRAGA